MSFLRCEEPRKYSYYDYEEPIPISLGTYYDHTTVCEEPRKYSYYDYEEPIHISLGTYYDHTMWGT